MKIKENYSCDHWLLLRHNCKSEGHQAKIGGTYSTIMGKRRKERARTERWGNAGVSDVILLCARYMSAIGMHLMKKGTFALSIKCALITMMVTGTQMKPEYRLGICKQIVASQYMCGLHTIKTRRKAGHIGVGIFSSRLETPCKDRGPLLARSRETTPMTDKKAYDDKGKVGFFSGSRKPIR